MRASGSGGGGGATAAAASHVDKQPAEAELREDADGEGGEELEEAPPHAKRRELL
jgi:hypothetical protein